MKLAVNGLAGLRVLRDLRRRDPSALRRRIDPPAPDPAPRKRWTVGALPLDALLLSEPPTKKRPLDVAVPRPAQRLGAGFARNTVYGAGVRPGSFVDAGNGVAIPSPEAPVRLVRSAACGFPSSCFWATSCAGPLAGTRPIP